MLTSFVKLQMPVGMPPDTEQFAKAKQEHGEMLCVHVNWVNTQAGSKSLKGIEKAERLYGLYQALSWCRQV